MVDVDGVRYEAHNSIPWRTDPQTCFRVLTKPADPQPSAHLAAMLATVRLKAEGLEAGLLRKVLNPAGEVATELAGVGLAAIARTASLTAAMTPATPPNGSLSQYVAAIRPSPNALAATVGSAGTII